MGIWTSPLYLIKVAYEEVLINDHIILLSFCRVLEHIESKYWLPVGRDNQEIKKMLTRLRSHSYGSAKETLKNPNIIKDAINRGITSAKAFTLNLAIPDAYNREPSDENSSNFNICKPITQVANSVPSGSNLCRIKRLYENELNVATFNRIAVFKSAGSSPLFIDPANNLIDFGHMVYGFESLLYANPDYVLVKATDTSAAIPSDGFQNFGITDANVFTGFVADIATGIAEAYVTNKRGDANNTYQELQDIEYRKSANSADLLSDIDAIGLAFTYRNITGSNIKFSDVLEKYYGATAPAHGGHYTNRFKIFCKVFDLIENTGVATNNGYIWKGNQIAVKQSILDKMEDFANFWLNKIENREKSFVALAIPSTHNYISFLNIDFSTECTGILGSKFLVFIKNNLENEQSWNF